jgi:arylsulfatase A-like enzyme
VLFCNRKIVDEKPAIVDVAPTIMKLFGLALPGHFDGKPWTVGPSPASVSVPSTAPQPSAGD